jgi:hypothetical protein
MSVRNGVSASAKGLRAERFGISSRTGAPMGGNCTTLREPPWLRCQAGERVRVGPAHVR